MPSLSALHTKWFLNINGIFSGLPSVPRHSGSSISAYTDGNLVTPLIDGEAYMRIWHDSIRAMVSQANCEIYQAGWTLDDVRTLGFAQGDSDALSTLIDAHNGGVRAYVVLSKHLTKFTSNRKSLESLQNKGLSTACFDNRYPTAGSIHQKFVCLKGPAEFRVLLGSMDIAKERWDTSEHSNANYQRDPDKGKPTHDLGVLIQGPAVADIERVFQHRWNDATSNQRLEPIGQPQITTPVSSPATFGPHSIQVLQTYGQGSGYSWSQTGEFTVWAAYLKAIKAARQYIYIEDQYFHAFGFPPYFELGGSSLARDTDIVYQLGQAMINHNVKIIIVIPSNAEDLFDIYQKYQRDLGVRYLMEIADGGAGDLVVASLQKSSPAGDTPIYVHSKLMICDDEYVLTGSANVGRRSMTCDGELSVGIIDANNVFARDLRVALWREHMGDQSLSLNNFGNAFDLFKEYTFEYEDHWIRGDRLRPYPVDVDVSPAEEPPGHTLGWQSIDPYHGPEGIDLPFTLGLQ